MMAPSSAPMAGPALPSWPAVSLEMVCGMAIWVSYPYTTSVDAKGGGEQNRLVARESCYYFCCQ